VRFTFEKCFVFELFVNGFEKSVFKIITKRGSILCVIMVCIMLGFDLILLSHGGEPIHDYS
jgi:Na+/H+-dicarboxylate symporter